MYTSDRTTPRFTLNVPVRLRRLDQSDSIEYTVETSNLSEGGMYFASDIQFEMDTPVRACLEMPEQIFGKPNVRWCCDGRVVHLDPLGPLDSRLGVGIAFHTYAVLTAGRPESTAMSAGHCGTSSPRSGRGTEALTATSPNHCRAPAQQRWPDELQTLASSCRGRRVAVNSVR